MLEYKDRLIIRQVAFKGAIELLKEKNQHDEITKEMLEKVTDWGVEILEKPFVQEQKEYEQKFTSELQSQKKKLF